MRYADIAAQVFFQSLYQILQVSVCFVANEVCSEFLQHFGYDSSQGAH